METVTSRDLVQRPSEIRKLLAARKTLRWTSQGVPMALIQSVLSEAKEKNGLDFPRPCHRGSQPVQIPDFGFHLRRPGQRFPPLMAKVYFDAGAIVKLYIVESGSKLFQ